MKEIWRDSDLPSSCLLPKWKQLPGLKQTETKGQELLSGLCVGGRIPSSGNQQNNRM